MSWPPFAPALLLSWPIQQSCPPGPSIDFWNSTGSSHQPFAKSHSTCGPLNLRTSISLPVKVVKAFHVPPPSSWIGKKASWNGCSPGIPTLVRPMKLSNPERSTDLQLSPLARHTSAVVGWHHSSPTLIRSASRDHPPPALLCAYYRLTAPSRPSVPLIGHLSVLCHCPTILLSRPHRCPSGRVSRLVSESPTPGFTSFPSPFFCPERPQVTTAWTDMACLSHPTPWTPLRRRPPPRSHGPSLLHLTPDLLPHLEYPSPTLPFSSAGRYGAPPRLHHRLPRPQSHL